MPIAPKKIAALTAAFTVPLLLFPTGGLALAAKQTDRETPSVSSEIAGAQVALDIDQKNVDVSQGDAAITATAHISNPEAYASDRYILALTHPSGQTRRSISLQLDSGSSIDGIWKAEFSIGPYIANGTWTATLRQSGYNSDPWDSSTALATKTLIISGGSITDIEPPVLGEHSVSPAKLKLSDVPGQASIRLRLEDPSGVSKPEIYATRLDPLSDQEAMPFKHSETWHLIEGNDKSSLWETSFIFRKSENPSGAYSLMLKSPTDKLGNQGFRDIELGTVEVDNAGDVKAIRPVIKGVPHVGQTLTADIGNWGGSDVFVYYRWYVEGAPGYRQQRYHNGDTPTLELTSQHIGKPVYIEVTGGKDGYPARTAVSKRTENVADKLPFADIQARAWYYAPVSWMVDREITTGYANGTFRPFNPVTRGEAVTFLYRYVDDNDFTAPQTLDMKDVPSSHNFFEEIAWATQNGVVNGYKDNTFRSGKNMTRAEVAAVLYRQAKPQHSTPAKSPFKDLTPKSNQYEAITWLAQQEITTGRADDTFDPGANVTRAELATFLQRYNEVLTK